MLNETNTLGPCPLCGGKLTFDPGDSETLCLECHIAMDARGLGRLSAIAAQNKRMREALERCRDTFKRYANGHRAKGTPEGEEKARNNDRMFRICEEEMK